MSINFLPIHVAIIPDGNNRWAQKRFLLPTEGYKAGMKTIEEIAEYVDSLGIQYLTVYLMSLENLNRRSAKWLDNFFIFASDAIKEYTQRDEINRFKIQVIGNLLELPRFLRLEIENLIEKTKDNKGLTLTLAIAYTGRDEIVRSTNNLIMDRMTRYKKGGESILPVTEEEFDKHLDLKGIPSPDLLIRTAGDLRLSGFLLWHLAYTEFVFVSELWPDFTIEKLENIFTDYKKRVRNFGRERRENIE